MQTKWRMIKRAILTELTGAVDDDGLAMRGDQVLIFRAFQKYDQRFPRGCRRFGRFPDG